MPDDQESEKRQIDDVTRQLFASFDNRGGKAVRLENLHGLFVPECVIVKTCGTSPTVYSLAEFIEPRQKLLNGGQLLEFSEEEIWERTAIFGNIAQRLCSYRKSGVRDDDRFEVEGMKSIQFVNTEQGWRICSVAWDDERDGVVLPACCRGN